MSCPVCRSDDVRCQHTMPEQHLSLDLMMSVLRDENAEIQELKEQLQLVTDQVMALSLALGANATVRTAVTTNTSTYRHILSSGDDEEEGDEDEEEEEEEEEEERKRREEDEEEAEDEEEIVRHDVYMPIAHFLQMQHLLDMQRTLALMNDSSRR